MCFPASPRERRHINKFDPHPFPMEVEGMQAPPGLVGEAMPAKGPPMNAQEMFRGIMEQGEINPTETHRTTTGDKETVLVGLIFIQWWY